MKAGFLLGGHLLPLGLSALLLLLGGCSGPPAHALSYLIAMWGAGLGAPPRFLALGYLDDLLLMGYDSRRGTTQPGAPWMRRAEEADPNYWRWQSWGAAHLQRKFVEDVAKLQQHSNQTAEPYTFQRIVRCELGEDGQRGALMRYAYDGRDLLRFEKGNLTWTAVGAPGQVLKAGWDADLAASQRSAAFLETRCPELLLQYLDYGKEALLRTEPPVLKVARKVARDDGQETHVCRAHGFYPKEVAISWRRGGEAWEEDTLRGGVTPNSDGTYHTWLSVRVDPEDRGGFRCRVEHAGLPAPLEVAWEEPASVWPMVGGLLAAALLLLVAGILTFCSKYAPLPRRFRPQETHLLTEQAQSLQLPPRGPGAGISLHSSVKNMDKIKLQMKEGQRHAVSARRFLSAGVVGEDPLSPPGGCPLPGRLGSGGRRAMRTLLGGLLLLGACCCWAGSSSSSSSAHSLRYFYTSIWEPGQGQPHFIGVGYVDDQLGGYYDSHRRQAVPRAPWMRRVERDDPHFWVWNTQKALNHELRFRDDLLELWRQNNRTGGIYTLQRMYGCALQGGAQKAGFEQYGYNGRDFLSFDKETLTWTAAAAAAQVTKRRLDGEVVRSQSLRAYLEEECLEWLQKFLAYGAGALLRKVIGEGPSRPFAEPPVVTVTRKDSHDGLETLLCRAHGFYPREIDATWRRSGEVRQGDTFRGTVSPNADGTYYAWLSIEVDPQERSRFRCHVEHDGLQEPLDVAVEEAGPSVGATAGGTVGALAAVVLLATGIVLYLRRRLRGGYGKASASDLGSDGSLRACQSGPE
ncbi:hypothetical protein lerEdw1_013642 [Lerista edwardsae]|nr:hypothetical protein lerEdw1_013642 [Lerista edwardsae]